MKPQVTAVPVDTAFLDVHLPGWDYADAYDLELRGTGPDGALTAARCLLGSRSGHLVLRARDLLVGVVGLRPAVTGAHDLFPVLVDTPHLAVVGLDDSHLDFRILVSLDHRRVRCVTVVRRHNRLGHAYFSAVGPFHRRLVPHLLARAERRGWRVAAGSDHARLAPVPAPTVRQSSE